MLSHVFTKAVEWGYIDQHPFKGEVRFKGDKPRSRYVEDWEIVECLSLPAKYSYDKTLVIQAYIRLKLLTGLRKTDLLKAQVKDCKEEGLYVKISKTGQDILFEWTQELKDTISDIKECRPVHISPFLFCNRRGQGYMNENTGRCSGWDSTWQRFMKRLLEETKIIDKFTEHDLRAKVGSDAESLARAQQILAHANSSTTKKIYRRKIEVIKPTK